MHCDHHGFRKVTTDGNDTCQSANLFARRYLVPISASLNNTFHTPTVVLSLHVFPFIEWNPTPTSSLHLQFAFRLQSAVYNQTLVRSTAAQF